MIQGINDYAAAAKYLKDIYGLINKEYFENSLHDVNILSSYLNRPIVDVVCTLLHEARHLYAFMNGIADVSKNGVYHTKKFKDISEARDLKIGQHPKYGWTITESTEQLIQWVEQHGLIDISLYRADFVIGSVDNATGVDGITKEVYLICGNDMVTLATEE